MVSEEWDDDYEDIDDSWIVDNEDFDYICDGCDCYYEECECHLICPECDLYYEQCSCDEEEE